MAKLDMSEVETVAYELKHKREENDEELLLKVQEQMRLDREREQEELRIMKEKSAERRRQRAEEERQLAAERLEREKLFRAEEAEKKREKEALEQQRKEERERKRLEEEERKQKIGRPNYVIVKKTRNNEENMDNVVKAKEDMAKSKEQLEAEKKAILSQRVAPLNIAGFDTAKLAEKAKEIHQAIWNLESEKYDLEQRFKKQQLEMMDLSERARQMNKGEDQRRSGHGSRTQKKKGAADSSFDRLSDKYSQAPPKIMMFSKYERQTDLRKFGERLSVFQSDTKNKPEVAPPANAEEAPAGDE